MKKATLFLVLLICFSGLVIANEYAKENLECWEQTMCNQPQEYSDVDFMEEVNIEGEEGELWNGTIEINEVSFEHNVTEEIDNTGFRTIDEQENKQVMFDGVIQVQSLCNEPVFSVDNDRSSKYEINVRGNDTYGVRSCYDHPTKVEYSMKLDTSSTEMKVIVDQNNVTESFQTDDFHGFAGGVPESPEENEEDDEKLEAENKGVLTNLLSIFDGLI